MKMIFLGVNSGPRKDGSTWYQISCWGRTAEGEMASRNYFVPDAVGKRLNEMKIKDPVQIEIKCGMSEKLYPAIVEVKVLERYDDPVFDLAEGGEHE